MKDNIKPEHYRTGEIDLYEAWYRTYPRNEYRAIMQAIAERYMRRDKNNRVEDLGKAIYTLERLREKEIEYVKQNAKTLEEELVYMGEAFVGSKKIETAGQYLDEIYYHHYDLLKRLQNEGYEYLARDKDLTLWAYKSMPKKSDKYWGRGGGCEVIEDDNFPEVKWADNKPTKISKLLASYENGVENGK